MQKLSPPLRHTLALTSALLGILMVFSHFFFLQLIGVLFLLIPGFLHPLYTLLIIIFSVPFGELGRLSLGGISFLLTDLTVLLSLPSLTLHALRSRPLHLPSPAWWLLTFILVALLSWLINFPALPTDTALQAFLYWIRLTSYALIFILTPFALPLNSHKKTILTATLLSITLTALLGFVQLRYFSDFIALGLDDIGYDPHQGRLTSTWLDPNFVGGLFAFGLSITLSLFLLTHKHRTLLAILSLIFLSALFYTFSRSAYLSFAVALAIIALFRARWLIPIGIIGLLLILGSGHRAGDRIWDMFDSITALQGSQTTTLDPTSRLRIENWSEALETISKNPILGTGYGAYAHAQWRTGHLKSLSAHHASGADSSLLTIWATTGTLGLLAFLGFLFSLARTLLFQAKNPLPLALLAGLAGIFVHSFFVNSLFFTLLLAIILPLTALYTK